ncbi:MAG: DNA integrity scanning protein DisA nucleotide-binding domain protein [Kiritimatiellae bacterium]|nr:DNA integrity scanning protein DisA nucleotide-binding domain protein [Kiritimatiellia bacterium]
MDVDETRVRTNAELARLTAQVALSVGPDAVVCGTETGAFFRQLKALGGEHRLIAATPNAETYDALVVTGEEVVRLSARVADKYRQARYVVSVALSMGRLSAGDLVVVALGQHLCKGGDLILVTDVDADTAKIALTELVKLTDGIRPNVLEAALQLACRIAMVSHGGKHMGALLTIGDSDKILEGARQLVLNPLQGHDETERTLLNPASHEMLIELAKLDGAFVVRDDGLVQTAGTFLAASGADVSVPKGLGARHVAAAATTARTRACAIAVSATDSYVRVFSGGRIVLEMDPQIAVTHL